MKRHPARSTEFAFPDDQEGLTPIDVGELELPGLGNPQSGAGQQPKERLPGVGAQLAFQSAGALE
jgi:hypothetical protein